MCDKEPYDTEAKARAAARGISKTKKSGSMGHYWCDLCEAWHVKTEGKRKHRRNNNKYPFRYHPKKKK